MLVVVCGHFDPLHRGHVDHIRKASELGGHLIVIVNNDAQIIKRNGSIFMPLEKRVERIFKKCPFITGVVVSIDKDDTQSETLRFLHPDIFAKGGDRVCGTLPQSELDACKEIGCKIVYGVGRKLCSSTAIRQRTAMLRNKGIGK